MGRLLRILLVVAFLAAVACLAIQALRRRSRSWPAPEPGWVAPTIVPVVTVEEDASLEQEIADAEAEGMRAPDWQPATDVAIGETGRIVEPEPPAVDAVVEPVAEEAPPPWAEADAPAIADDEAFATPTEPPGDAGVRDAEEAAVDFAAMLVEDEPEPAGPPGEATTEPRDRPPPEEAPGALPEADDILRRFEELAAMPEEAPAAEPAVPPPVPPPAAEDPLLTSVEQALDDLQPAPIQPPPRRSAESYLDEGNVYFNVGQFALAIDRYTQAILLDPDLTAAYYNRANAYTRSGEFERALGDYNRALELLPGDADALNNRGMLHLYRGSYAAAIADFNAALEVDPGDTTVMVNRGLAHLQSGDAAAALIDFLAATRLDGEDAAARYGAAQASAILGNRDEALRHVERALAIDPAYAREAAGDPRLALLQGDPEFLRLLREAGRS
jgi:tetratricopeptide (TPR) repeat protein